MKGSGGTEGGLGQFAIGFGLAMLALYLFFDSIRVSSGIGMVSRGLFGGRGSGGFWETTSMGIVFMPFFLGVLALFYDAKQKWAWWLMWLGVAVMAVEIISCMRFRFDIKTTHFLGMLTLFAAGAAMMMRSYREPDGAGGGGSDDKTEGTV
jgi:hypothetical protein